MGFMICGGGGVGYWAERVIESQFFYRFSYCVGGEGEACLSKLGRLAKVF